jgi:hypothetical protein
MTEMSKRVTHPLDRHQSDRNRPSSMLTKGIALKKEHVVLCWDSYLPDGLINVITFKFVTRCMHEVKIALPSGCSRRPTFLRVAFSPDHLLRCFDWMIYSTSDGPVRARSH